MLDMRLIREKEAAVRKALSRRGIETPLETLITMDRRRRGLVTEVEELKCRRNKESEEIGKLRKAGQDTASRQAEVKAIGEKIADLDQQVQAIQSEQDAMVLTIPNLPHASVPDGTTAAENVVVRSYGEPRTFAFQPQTHMDIGERLGLIDFPRATRMTGAGFPLLVGQGSRLQRALIQFMLDLHTREHGYVEVLPPFVCNTAAMTGTGQLPKMAEDMYHVPADDLWLVPTAEVPVTNIYMQEIIERPLPIYLTAYTPCFRREAGAAGRDTRGMIRVHQFDKVEMVKFVEPETSYQELETLVGQAEDVLKRLGLTYRVLSLCAGDMSFAAAKCYDIELWAPGQNAWLEVSSCSNFESFQARRANIRYRNKNRKVEFVHTLNGSGVALARLMVAIIENGQQADGSVELPEAIVPYMGGVRKLEPVQADRRL